MCLNLWKCWEEPNTPSENWEKGQGKDVSQKIVLSLTSSWTRKEQWKVWRSLWDISLSPLSLESSMRTEAWETETEARMKNWVEARDWVALKGFSSLLIPKTALWEVSRCITSKNNLQELVMAEKYLDTLGSVQRWKTQCSYFCFSPCSCIPSSLSDLLQLPSPSALPRIQKNHS